MSLGHPLALRWAAIHKVDVLRVLRVDLREVLLVVLESRIQCPTETVHNIPGFLQHGPKQPLSQQRIINPGDNLLNRTGTLSPIHVLQQGVLPRAQALYTTSQ